MNTRTQKLETSGIQNAASRAGWFNNGNTACRIAQPVEMCHHSRWALKCENAVYTAQIAGLIRINLLALSQTSVITPKKALDR